MTIRDDSEDNVAAIAAESKWDYLLDQLQNWNHWNIQINKLWFKNTDSASLIATVIYLYFYSQQILATWNIESVHLKQCYIFLVTSAVNTSSAKDKKLYIQRGD